MRQEQGKYEGKSREVEATAGRIWDKGRAYVGKGKNTVVKGMTNIWGQQARRCICIERRQTPGKIHMRAGVEQVWVQGKAACRGGQGTYNGSGRECVGAMKGLMWDKGRVYFREIAK